MAKGKALGKFGVAVAILVVVAGFVYWFVLPRPSFSDAKPNAIESRTIRTRSGGHLTLVRPRINGEDVGWFVLDSGASGSAIDANHADRLGMWTLLRLQANECMPAAIRRARSLELGPLTIHNPLIGSIDFSLVPHLTEEVEVELAGVLGYDIFADAVVEIAFGGDFDDDQVAVYTPGEYLLRGGSWYDLRVVDKRPVFPARFEGGRAGLFLIDTGKTSALSFYAEFVRKHRLTEGRELVRKATKGLCGESFQLDGTVEWVELAGIRFDRPTVGFKAPGTLHDNWRPGVSGSIGQGFLRNFTVVFNYSEEKIAFLQE